MLSRLLTAAFIVSSSYALPTMATEHPLNQDVAIVIADTYYHNPVNLAHAWRLHWHATGQLLESAVSKNYSNARWCKQQASAKLVLSLEPYLFYNPQLQTYYAEVIAKAYTKPDGQTFSLRPAFTIKEEATQVGSLNVSPDFFAQKAYEKAVANLMTKLNTNQDYQTATSTQTVQDMDNLCVALEQSKPSKLYY